ncbi:hypothetical protein D3C81_1646040 [compost metagenome]
MPVGRGRQVDHAEAAFVDADIHGAAPQRLLHLEAVHLLEVDAHARAGGGTALDIERQELDHGGFRRSNAHHAKIAADKGGRIVLHALHGVGDAARVGQQGAAGFGQRHAVGQAFEQRHAQLGLQFEDAARGCGRGQVQPLGATRDAAEFGHGDEQLDGREIEMQPGAAQGQGGRHDGRR